jgi:hypothetical protein
VAKPFVQRDTNTVENDYIRLAPSVVKPGILDLCWRPSPGAAWESYNNIVVTAWRGGVAGNSEIQRAAPLIVDAERRGGGSVVRVTYDYPAFSNRANVLQERCNDAAMQLVVEIPDGPLLRTQMFSRNDVDTAGVNNYWGFRHRVRFMDTGEEICDVNEPRWCEGVQDGYYIEGKWHRLGYHGMMLTFWGADGPMQWQCAPADRATLVLEVRKSPWDPSQGPVGQAPWFETVSIERAPFRQGDETWFGFIREREGLASQDSASADQS